MKKPKSITDLFADHPASNQISQYQQKTRDFSQIHKILSQILGDNIAQNIIISNYKNAILYLETHSAAVATGFKMYQSQVLSAMRQQISAATITVEIKVSPKSTQIKTHQNKPETLAKQRTIPKEAASLLTSIANNSDGKLKEKLLQLAKHSKK